jgi:glycosyltransferase involved in cell wall biosynthesis
MNINILGPINQLGYGIASLNIVKALTKENNVSLFVIGQPQVTNQEDADIVSQTMKNSQYADFKAPCVRIWHQHDMSQFVGRGQRIGFPIFELNKFSDVEKHHLSSLDKIFVCSNWAKQVVLNNIDITEDNVCVIPLGVDRSIFRNENKSKGKSTIFFNCGKWEIRKGHDILVDIFNNAFSEEDNVELWMMCDNPFLTRQETGQWHDLYKTSKLGSKIKILPRLSTQQEVYNLMQSIDCGLFPSRAEGWNLELLELMSCGKPVITTNYAAHTEFCNKDNAYLVDIDRLELAKDGKWFFGQGDWAKIGKEQIDQFVNYIQNVHQLKTNNELPINNQGIETANKFSWQNAAKEIIKHV